VQLLLNSGANTETADENNATPLYIAAEKGHAAVVQLLLQSWANTGAVDVDGVTPY